jgi:prevent-host-death family protein
MKEIPISEFRAKCLAILRQVQKTKKPIRITRFGKAIAEVVPAPPTRSTDRIGSMKGSIEILGDIVSPANEESDWKALREEIGGGVEQADRGELVDGPRTFAKIRAKSARQRRGKGVRSDRL